MSMKSIGILTFHRALNYGAILQTYALQKALEQCGADAKIIDYRAEFNERRFERQKLKTLVKPRQLYGVIFRNAYMLFDRGPFEGFYRRMQFTAPCYQLKELHKECNALDRVVVGSDQVWNLACTEEDDAYFLPFLKEREKKCSYAASFGFEQIPSEYQQAYKTYLQDFSMISVREKSGVRIVKDLIGKQADYNVDPTLMIPKEEWASIAENTLVPKTPYVLLYLMSEDQKLIRFAKTLAKQKKCTIVYINDRLLKLHGAKNVRKIKPEQWLGLFQNAAYICTNSFHGTAFSINMNKQFFLRYIPRSIANSRLQCIIEEYGLSERLIENWNGEELTYAAINEKLDANRQKALSYLGEIVQGTVHE